MSNEFKLTTLDNKEIPLQSVNYSITVCNANCDVTIDQVYKNTETNTIEVLYVFPTPKGISIHDFEADINGKIVKTQIKEKETAVKDYNDAVKKGNQAFLMEKLDGDTFSVCLGNIPGNADVKIKISGCLDLDTEIDATRLRLCVPSTIMKKYSSKGSPTFLGSVVNNVERVANKPYDMKISGSILMSDGLVSIDSKTHPIQISNMQHNQADFVISPEQLDSDIILTITRKTPKTLMITSKADDVPPEFRYASQMNIVPDFSLVPECSIVDTSYVILLDSSGSMDGEDFKNCIQSGIMFVASLPLGSNFNVYNFASDFHKFKNELVTVTPESKQEATKWMNSVKCGGGTEVLAPLEDAYTTLKESNSVIIFLSDGGVDNTDKVIRTVKQNKHVGVYTIGIGQNVSQSLIKEMAEQSVGGIAEFINNSRDQLEEKVLAQLNRAQQKLRKCQKNNTIRVDTTGPYKMIPEVKYLYEGDVNTFYIFSENSIDSVCYNQCNGDGEVMSMVVVHPSYYESENNFIHKLSGIKLLNELYTAENIVKPKGSQIAHLNSQAVELEKKTNKDRIVQVSQGLNILSKYTAFIGVEIVDNKDGVPQTAVLKQIPLQQIRKYREESGFECCSIQNCSARSFSQPNSMSMFASAARGPIAKGISFDSSEEEEGCESEFDYSFENKNEVRPTSASLQSGGFMSSMLNSVSSMFGSNNTTTTTTTTTSTKPTVVAKYVVTTKLPDYDVLGGILSAKANGELPFIAEVQVGDYIELTTEGQHNGFYKVIKLGSKDSPWVLKKC